MSYVFHNKIQISKVNSTCISPENFFDPSQELICIAVCLNRRRFLVIVEDVCSLNHKIDYAHCNLFHVQIHCHDFTVAVLRTCCSDWELQSVMVWLQPPHQLLHKHCRLMRGAVVMLVLRLVSGSQGRVGTGGPSKCSELGQTWPVCPTDWPGLG